MDASKPTSAPAVVTCNPSLLLKLSLLQQILHCWSLSLHKAGEGAAPHCPGITLLLVPWDSSKKQSLSSEDTEEKGQSSNCTLPCNSNSHRDRSAPGPGELSKRVRQTHKVTLAPHCSTNSQEKILFFSSLPLRETQSSSQSHNCKTPQAEEQVNRKSKFKERFAGVEAVCVRESLDAPVSPAPASSPPSELAGKGANPSYGPAANIAWNWGTWGTPDESAERAEIPTLVASTANSTDALRPQT